MLVSNVYREFTVYCMLQWQDQLLHLLPQEMQARGAECAAAALQQKQNADAALSDKPRQKAAPSVSEAQTSQPAPNGIYHKMSSVLSLSCMLGCIQ